MMEKWNKEEVYEAIDEIANIRLKYNLYSDSKRIASRHRACNLAIKALRDVIGEPVTSAVNVYSSDTKEKAMCANCVYCEYTTDGRGGEWYSCLYPGEKRDMNWDSVCKDFESVTIEKIRRINNEKNNAEATLELLDKMNKSILGICTEDNKNAILLTKEMQEIFYKFLYTSYKDKITKLETKLINL